MAMVNLFFLCLGVLLYQYLNAKGLQLPLNDAGKPMTDRLFPMLALEHLGLFAGMAFIIGLTAATFSSADSVLTTLTTSFYIDLLKADQRDNWTEEMKRRRRNIIHTSFAVLLLLVILVFKAMNNSAIIDTVLMLAGYTYGPLLGLFAFGVLTKRKIRDKWVPLICLAAPLIIYILDKNDEQWFGGYQFGNELLLVNGLLTFAGLWIISQKE
jgi:Na+/proline symporter